MKTVGELYIDSVRISPNLVLAPMAGVTDSSFRRLIKELGGVGLIVTEFISVEGLTRGNMTTHRMMKFLPEERPLSIQIFGHDEERMAQAAEIIEEVGADIVDINCGCPAKKVVKGGGGSSLLRDLPQLEKILRRVRRAVSIPLTMKIRTGWDESSINAVEVGKLIEDCGANMIAIHGRTRMQGYSGKADWGVIAAVKRAVKIPVIGCGDVVTPEQAAQRLDETGVDAVMIGRGAIANPWIFRQTSDLMRGEAVYEPSLSEKQRVLHRYYELLQGEMSETGLCGKLKQMCGYFTHGLPGGARLRERVFHSQTISEIFDTVDDYFATMIEHGVPPEALRPKESAEPAVVKQPRDPKCLEFTRLAG
ncbi:MAG TPA: tRNA dihydrouridine synthase DusB [Blastocatellia bacterium]|jgi:nifR3 family TIM-barrel protein|nr:tRNA dihydrouridine synthase DusB [Blastocatellia bacterium]